MNADDKDNRQVEREISTALGAAEDGLLEEADRKQLNKLLTQSQHARSYYLDLTALRVSLLSIAGRSVLNQAKDTFDAVEKISDGVEVSVDRKHDLDKPHPDKRNKISPGKESVQSNRLRFQGLLFLATAAALVFSAWLYTITGDGAQNKELTYSVTNVEEKFLGKVAKVSNVSPGAIWNDPNESLSIEASLRDGQEIRLLKGEIELTYTSGVSLQLFGPVKYKLSKEGGVLATGGLLASVPEAGRGFTVETHNGKIVDLGTEFGIMVDDFGYSEVGVFKGKVEAYPRTKERQDKNDSSAFELYKGDGLLWTKSRHARIATDARRFTSGRPKRAAFSLTSDSPVYELASTSTLVDTSWRTLGNVDSGASAYTMTGTAKGERPFLISESSFDPSLGQITIECDVIFDSENSLEGSMAILTRCDTQRGLASPPWNDMLSTCVRCSINSNTNSEVGVIDASTKHETGWEPVVLSWQGFQKPKPGERYRMHMTDDGVNVTFTVALASNPSIRKTVSCRSLFRGVRNRIAIEGPMIGSASVENIRVYQESISPSDNLFAKGLEEVPNSDSIDHDRIENKILRELIPANASRLLYETFEKSKLDNKTWKSLGTATIKDGRLQLGDYADDSVIDTWHRRPYLITKNKYSPEDGAITVIVKFEFAGNFLSGYGGSFAVMTRASDTYRESGGWEKSLLSKGVRSNFWPSGLGINRSLEFHEIVQDGSVGLLTSAPYEIEPLARSYYFKVVDDGMAVNQTIVDASNPSSRCSLTYDSIGRDSISPARIGFESTWGSPVMLDEISIYQDMP